VQSRWTLTGFSQDLGAALRRGLVGTAREIAFLETHVVEHALHERDVLRLATVRCARHRELRAFPAQLIEAAGREERDYLEWLGAGSPERECVTVAGGAE
jgi:hypothetical protein